MTNAHGCDISVWQDLDSTPQMFDPARARSVGLSFVGIKVSQANWADPDYARNWYNCRPYLYRMPYHFLTWDVAPFKQAETFWSLIEKDTFGLLPLVCDFEWWKVTPPEAMDKLYNFTYRLKQLVDPLPKGVYSSFQFWKEHGSKSDYWKQFNLWLCDISGAVDVPAPWANWDFHQYTFKGSGLYYGAESLDLDLDWYNGTVEQMRTRYNLPDIGLGEEMPEEQVSNQVRVTWPGGMNFRSYPHETAKLLGMAYFGGEFEVIERRQVGNDEWLKLAVWMASRYNGRDKVVVVK